MKLLQACMFGFALLSLAAPGTAEIDFDTAGASAPAGAGVLIPVTINANGESVSALALRASYDDTRLTPVLIEGGSSAVMAGKSIAFSAASGVLTVSVSGGEAVIPDGLLLEILFVIDAAAPVNTPLTIEDGGSDAATPSAELLDAAVVSFSITPLANEGQHDADSDGDWKISLSELLRIIQFYNSDSFHCEGGTEDGYAPGLGAQDCFPHDSDYLLQDWEVDLSELLRLIQLFNTLQGYYQSDAGGEDGFAPGPYQPL